MKEKIEKTKLFLLETRELLTEEKGKYTVADKTMMPGCLEKLMFNVQEAIETCDNELSNLKK